jgi:hypothetical protein
MIMATTAPSTKPITFASTLADAKAQTLVLVSGVVMVGASLALSFWPGVQGHHLTLADDMTAAGVKVIASLVVVALILERALAAFDDLLFGQALTDARQGIAIAPNGSVEQIDTARERARLILGLAAGLLISAAGMRTLLGLTKMPTLDSFQTAIDIWLTAGLLAGGSNGLAKLVDVLHEGAAQRVSASRLQGMQNEVQRRAIIESAKP